MLVPSVSLMRKSVPARRRTPSPWLRLASDVVPSNLKPCTSVVLMPIPPLSSDSRTLAPPSSVAPPPGTARPLRPAVEPVTSSPRSAASEETDDPWTLVVAPVAFESPKLIPVPLPFSVAVRRDGLAAWMALRTSRMVLALVRLILTWVPSLSRILRSLADTLTPAPRFSAVSAVLEASALKPLAFIRLPPAPPTSHARSMPDSESTSAPIVNWPLVTVKLVSLASYTVSRPRPPSIMSAPRPPVIVSSPAPPIKVLARSLPKIVSANAEPVTLLKPESSLKSVDSPPARFTTTACAAAEKSSVLVPEPPTRISTPSNARLFVPLTIVKPPSASWVTVTFSVTLLKSILSMPSPSLPPAASITVSTSQPGRST